LRTVRLQCNDSGILYAVRPASIAGLLLIGICALGLSAEPQQIPGAPGAPAQQVPAIPSQNPQQTSPIQTAQRNTLALVVLDPAHGGTDPGAHGTSGITESDVVLTFARLLRISLEAQGFRVVLTRTANDTVSFDDRSKIANAQRGAVFITLHVSSTGPAGTARVYSLPQLNAPTASPASSNGRPALIPWDHAQQGFLDASQKLAALVQTQLTQRFHGSPDAPITANVRQLRTIAAPAIAVEVSSVSLPDRSVLDQMAPVLADGVARGVAAFRPIYEEGAN
jgi:N-acetylmuramoyl-L-alanine amidase